MVIINIYVYKRTSQTQYTNSHDYMKFASGVALLLACVAGVGKGRGRELGRETTREGREERRREGREISSRFTNDIRLVTQLA